LLESKKSIAAVLVAKGYEPGTQDYAEASAGLSLRALYTAFTSGKSLNTQELLDSMSTLAEHQASEARVAAYWREEWGGKGVELTPKGQEIIDQFNRGMDRLFGGGKGDISPAEDPFEQFANRDVVMNMSPEAYFQQMIYAMNAVYGANEGPAAPRQGSGGRGIGWDASDSYRDARGN
jgi:hypothetical protein